MEYLLTCKHREEGCRAVVKGWNVKGYLSIGYGVNGIQIKSKQVDFRACRVSAGVGVHRRRGRRLTCARAPPDTSTSSTDRPCSYVTPTSQHPRKLHKVILCNASDCIWHVQKDSWYNLTHCLYLIIGYILTINIKSINCGLLYL